jgi:hypothetical protein
MVVAIERSRHSGEKLQFFNNITSIGTTMNPRRVAKEASNFNSKERHYVKTNEMRLILIIKTLRIITKVLETIFFLGVIFWREKKFIYFNNITSSIMK